MRFTKIDKTITCGYREKVNSLISIINRIVEINTAISVKPEYVMTNTERLFFCVSVLNNLKGTTKPFSVEALQRYKKYFKESTDKRVISLYLGKLQKKKWVQYDRDFKVLDLPPLYQGIDLDSGVFNFSTTLNFEADVEEAERELK